MQLFNVNFAGADLKDYNFEQNLLEFCDFSGSNLTGANFHNAKIKYCDFSGANFMRADFSNTNFRDCDFSGAELNNANLSGLGSLYNCTGNGKEIRNLELPWYHIAYTKEFLQIGCQGHLIKDWFGFSNTTIAAMDSDMYSLPWWNEYKELIKESLRKQGADI